MTAIQATNVDALERELTEISGSTPLAQAYLDCFALAERAISALRQQQKELEARPGMPGDTPMTVRYVKGLEAERDRLREAIEKAPCPQQEGGVDAFCYCEQAVKIDCWKREALEPTKGSE